MHFTKFFSIVEAEREILNPVSPEKLMLLADYCGLRDGSRVLDVGSGKGYLLRRWARHRNIEGTGLEINPSFVASARELALQEGVGDRTEFVEGDAGEFVPEPAGYDMVVCIGAPFAIGSFEDALAWMLGALKPEGALAIGDRFLHASLPEGVAEREGIGPDDYRTLDETAAVIERHGLALTGLISASRDDWDAYTSSTWRAPHAWAATNPDDPDRDEVLRVVDQSRAEYLRFGRHHVGWGIFVARRDLA